MIIETEDYLEHYGKKGMRWGVRSANKEDYKVTTKVKVRPNSFKDKAKKAGKIGVGVAAAATILAGTVYVNRKLKARAFDKKYSDILRYNRENAIRVEEHMRKLRAIETSLGETVRR